jgi:hypothetical protein
VGGGGSGRRSCPRSWWGGGTPAAAQLPPPPSPQGSPTCCQVWLREHLESVAGKTFLNDKCDQREEAVPSRGLLPLVTSQVLGGLKMPGSAHLLLPDSVTLGQSPSRDGREGRRAVQRLGPLGVARSLPGMWSHPSGSKDRPQRRSAPGEQTVCPGSGRAGELWAPGSFCSPVAARPQLRAPREQACMQDVREQEAHLECGGAVPPRLACCSGPRVLRPAAGEPGLWRCGRAPSSQLRTGAPAALTRPLPAPRQPQPPRRGRSPAQRSVCFSSPTDVSQNIGHMFSGNKLGMSANTLGLRWLFQLPHGRLEREGVSTFHPVVAPSPPIRGGISPWRPSELETRAHSLPCTRPPSSVPISARRGVAPGEPWLLVNKVAIYKLLGR